MAARAERSAAALSRPRRVIESRDGVHVHVGGRDLVNFCSNDYLGLSQHLDVVSAFQEASAHYGVGSGASALVCGHHSEHAALEREADAAAGDALAEVAERHARLQGLGLLDVDLGLRIADRVDHLHQRPSVQLAVLGVDVDPQLLTRVNPFQGRGFEGVRDRRDHVGARNALFLFHVLEDREDFAAHRDWEVGKLGKKKRAAGPTFLKVRVRESETVSTRLKSCQAPLPRGIERPR